MLLAVLVSCAPSASPVRATPPVAEPDATVAAPEPLPPAEGEHLVIEQRPCPFGCPAYRLEVYATGHVRWVGYAFVSRMRETRSSIDPDEARALVERWHALDLDALPETFGEAVSATDVVPRVVTHVDEAGVETERWEGVVFDDADVARLGRGGVSKAQLEKLEALLVAANDSTGATRLIEPERCWSFDVFNGAARVGDANAAQVAVRHFEKHPTWFHVRISIIDTPSMRRHASTLLRTLVDDGVPRERILLEQLPALPDTLLPELARWGSGWVGVATLRCLGEQNE